MSDETPDAAPLVDEVYGELRRIAARYMRREHARSVEATELVHDAYLRMAQDRPMAFENRGHFVAIAAIAMRRLLVERARRRHAVKRGGHQVQVTLNDALLIDDGVRDGIDVITLDQALRTLATLDADQARIVELRFFGGLSIGETAEAMSLSPATIKRHWTLAKAWLLRELEGGRT